LAVARRSTPGAIEIALILADAWERWTGPIRPAHRGVQEMVSTPEPDDAGVDRPIVEADVRGTRGTGDYPAEAARCRR
jgi:hypothetical protein